MFSSCNWPWISTAIALLTISLSLQSSVTLQDQPQTPCNAVKILSYFPCTTVEGPASVEKCDIFAYVAVQLALDRIQQDQSIDINVTLIPFETGSGQVCYF